MGRPEGPGEARRARARDRAHRGCGPAGGCPAPSQARPGSGADSMPTFDVAQVVCAAVRTKLLSRGCDDDRSEVTGTAELELDLTGHADAPVLQATARTHGLRYRKLPPTDLTLAVSGPERETSRPRRRGRRSSAPSTWRARWGARWRSWCRTRTRRERWSPPSCAPAPASRASSSSRCTMRSSSRTRSKERSGSTPTWPALSTRPRASSRSGCRSSGYSRWTPPRSRWR